MNKNYLYIALAALVTIGAGYYLYDQLIKERAKNSLSDTNTKAEVLDDRFKEVVKKDKELARKEIVPSNEDGDKFWDRVLK